MMFFFTLVFLGVTSVVPNHSLIQNDNPEKQAIVTFEIIGSTKGYAHSTLFLVLDDTGLIHGVDYHFIDDAALTSLLSEQRGKIVLAISEEHKSSLSTLAEALAMIQEAAKPKTILTIYVKLNSLISGKSK